MFFNILEAYLGEYSLGKQHIMCLNLNLSNFIKSYDFVDETIY